MARNGIFSYNLLTIREIRVWDGIDLTNVHCVWVDSEFYAEILLTLLMSSSMWLWNDCFISTFVLFPFQMEIKAQGCSSNEGVMRKQPIKYANELTGLKVYYCDIRNTLGFKWKRTIWNYFFKFLKWHYNIFLQGNPHTGIHSLFKMN